MKAILIFKGNSLYISRSIMNYIIRTVVCSVTGMFFNQTIIGSCLRSGPHIMNHNRNRIITDYSASDSKVSVSNLMLCLNFYSTRHHRHQPKATVRNWLLTTIWIEKDLYIYI